VESLYVIHEGKCLKDYLLNFCGIMIHLTLVGASAGTRKDGQPRMNLPSIYIHNG
jgi:hypothetical protein